MSGVVVLRQLMLAHGALTALVPGTRIVSGVLPRATALPAISLMRISANDENIPAPGATRFVEERVQATVHGKDYTQVLAVLAQVRKACADKRPTVTGLSNVTVHTDSAGPDFMNEEASIHLREQDFMVRYNETTN